MNKSVAIIGAGIGGIAAALRIRKLGYQVTIFEQNEKAGGKIYEYRNKGYRFDTGPSLFTLPSLVNELFELWDKDSDDFYRYKKLNIICKYFYTDGEQINAYADPLDFANEVENKLNVPKNKLLAYLNKSEEIYHLTSGLFIFKAFRKLSTIFSKDMFNAILNANKLDAFQTVHQANEKWFGENHLVQLFDRYATYNGSNPYQAPATLNVIQHLEHNIGAYFPTKGMYSIVESLLKLAEEAGIEIRYNSSVKEIVTKKNRVVGINQNNKFLPFSKVVSNADVVPTYNMLNRTVPKSVTKFERSTSAIIFYWGIKKTFDNLSVHNILFSENYKEEFDCLFNSKTIYFDPTVYIFISAKEVSGDAPAGKENWFVMINVPENIGQDWDRIIEKSRSTIVAKINRILKTEIEDLIEFENVADPRTIENRTSAFHGSLYGSSSNSKWAAFLRHKNVSPKIKNLYFCGGTVHPGGGIPLCLSSAKIVANEF